MLKPVKSGAELIREIDQTLTATPTLWWLGHSGFIVRFANITFYVDPCFSTPEGRVRQVEAPLTGEMVKHADMILASHAHPGHLDGPTVAAMLAASPRAKLVVPRRTQEQAHAAGIPYDRMTTTDNGLRIEYFKDNLYGRIYAVPSAHPELEWASAGGYPYLGYLIRFGRWTIYHAGDCVAHPELADHLRPFNVNVALLPVGTGGFSASEAADLAKDIGARWLVPMHYGTFLDKEHLDAGQSQDRANDFEMHMLGHRPEQKFRTFQVGEKWTVPED